MSKLALGIDIGGTNTSFGIVNTDGAIIAQGRISTTGHGDIENYIACLKAEIEPMFAMVGRENIAGAGIGAPNGNFYTGEVVFAPNLPWKGVIPLAHLITESLNVKAVVTNDAKAAAIGEMYYGAAKGMRDFMMVTLGTGLGSGFVANGQIIYGHDGLAGELGHAIVVRNGRRCNCGRYGCLERYASATGIVITAEEWLRERRDDSSLRAIDGKLEAKMIQDAAQQGDRMAIEMYEYTAEILAYTLADAVAITSPQAIILFGGLAHAGELLTIPLKKHLEENLLAIYKNKISIMQSALPGADAAILGASALAW